MDKYTLIFGNLYRILHAAPGNLLGYWRDIERRAGSLALRSMSDPKSEGQPDTYGGPEANNQILAPTQANDYAGYAQTAGIACWF
jgi:hypothetical protein